MSRPWIEFIQSQWLPWAPHVLSRLRPGVDVKSLSCDVQTGACSLLVRYPPGFKSPRCTLTVDDELLVLEGELTTGSHGHERYGYAHFPGGYESGEWSSTNGAVVLECFSGAPAAASAPGGFDPSRVAAGVDAFDVPYTARFHPEFPAGAGRKLLYEDPVTHDTTWLLGTLPLRWAERSEVHTTIEEMYLIAGEVHGNRGLMTPGAYFWRPAQVPHGPYGTLTGNLYFFRSKGGPLSTTYVPAARPFRWWPHYDPALPPELETFRSRELPSVRCW